MQEVTQQGMTTSVLARPRFGRTAWGLLGVWLAMRLFLTGWAALVSPLRPLTEREQAIPLWPPSASWSAWLERVTLAPWQRWDTRYYLRIVQHGYHVDDGTAQFHPLFPWLATPLYALTGQSLLALLLLGSLASLLLLVAFQRLAELDLGRDRAFESTILLCLAPPAFVLFAPYTEALFLLWAVACFYWMRQRSWWLAGLAGGLAVLTRQQGLFLVFPLAWELWEASERRWRQALARWRDWLALLCIPLGLAIWLVYRAAVLGDLRASFAEPQALIYSLLISPSASKVVPVQAFLPPWHALWLALAKLWREPELSLVVDLLLGAGFLVLLAFAWRNLRLSYRIYTAVIVLVSFGYYTGPVFPYMGLPRHLLLAFPVFIGLGVRRLPWYARHLLIGGGLLASSFLLLLYVTESWTP